MIPPKEPRVSPEEGAAHTPGPWHYRPMEFDDWGIVRAYDGGFIVARAGGRARHGRL